MRFRELNNKYNITNVRWGVVRTRNLSNELDSATVVLTQISKINIEPFDLIEFTNENDELEYWLVANAQKEYVTYKSPFIFDYTVDLISPTKWLEMALLPNMTITNIGQNRSITHYINSVFNKYFKCNNLYKNKMTLATSSLYNTTIAKEYVFQTPTMREYMDSLYSQEAAIAKLDISKVSNDNYKLEVSPFQLNLNAGDLPIEDVDRIVGSNNMDSYITSLQSESSIINPIETLEYHTPISSELVSNSDNVKLTLNNKIYDIIKLIVKNIGFVINGLAEVSSLNNYYTNDQDTPIDGIRNVSFAVGTGTGQDIYPNPNNLNTDFGLTNKVDLDISDYIKPIDIFNSLQTLKAGEINNLLETYDKNYKNNTLFFTRGESAIENLVYLESKKVIWWNIDDYMAIVNAILAAGLKWIKEKFESGVYNFSYQRTSAGVIQTVYVSYYISCPSIRPYGWIEPHGNDANTKWGNIYKSILFQIQYKPYVDTRYTIDKNKTQHLIGSTDNSSNVNTDINLSIQQGFEKVKQLANDNLIMTGFQKVINSDYEPEFKIGQRYIDEDENVYVLTKIEWQTDKNSIKYKGTLSKNYSSNILNTTINREKRYYALSDVSSMVNRHEIVKQELVITTGNAAETYAAARAHHNIVVDSATFVNFSTKDSNNSTIVYGALPATTIKTKNLNIYDFNFKDNISFGDVISSTNTTGGYINEIKKYVDDNGEIAELWYSIGNDNGSVPESLAKYQYDIDSSAYITKTLNIDKDNRERLLISHQIRMIVNDPKIELKEVDWNSISNNGGIHQTNPIRCDFAIQESGYISNVRDDNVQNIFDYNFAYFTNGKKTTCSVYIHDKKNSYHLLMILFIPLNYSGELYLHGDLNNID